MQNIKKPILIATEDLGWFETITDQVGSNIEIISIKKIEDMEPKIKSPKELKIKAIEQAEQIEGSAVNDPEQNWRASRHSTDRTLPKTKKQKKARAANNRARKARKINRK